MSQIEDVPDHHTTRYDIIILFFFGVVRDANYSERPYLPSVSQMRRTRTRTGHSRPVE
jgi:hypothetical protein